MSFFVVPLVAVGDVAGGAARAAIVAALLPRGHAHVAALALVALVRERGQGGIFGDLVHRGQRQGFHVGGELVGVGGNEFLHVLLVGVRAEHGGRAVGVVQRVVGELHLAPFPIFALDAPGPQVPLDLARLGVHEGETQGIAVVDVAFAARLVHNPGVAGIRIELTRVRLLGRGGLGVAVVAGGTFSQGHDLLHHLAVGIANGLDALVTARHGAVFLGGLLWEGTRGGVGLVGLHAGRAAVEEGDQRHDGDQPEKDQPGSLHATTSLL